MFFDGTQTIIGRGAQAVMGLSDEDSGKILPIIERLKKCLLLEEKFRKCR